MTRQCNDRSSATELSLWLREQKRISSGYGYIATNIDYTWQNYKTGNWIFIEEKRYGHDVSWCQEKMMVMVNRAIIDPFYLGMFLVVFEKTSPDDGRIFVEKLGHRKKKYELTREGFFLFLEFDPKFFPVQCSTIESSKITDDNIKSFIVNVEDGKYA